MSEPQTSTTTEISKLMGSLLSGVLPKIDALLGGQLRRTAEQFSHIVDGNNQFIRNGKENLLYETRGHGVINTTLLLSYALVEPVAHTLQGAGNGLVDVLAYGEWERTGSAMGFAKDGLRTMAVVDAGGGVRAMPRRFAPLVNRFVPGGMASCGVTSLTKCLNLAGHEMRISLDDAAGAFGSSQALALAPEYGGIPSAAMPNLSNILFGVGHHSTAVRFADPGSFTSVLDELARGVSATGDPHAIWLSWHNDTGHIMTAYSWAGKLHLTDQFGTWVPDVVQGGGRRLLNINPTALGKGRKVLTINAADVRNAHPTALRMFGVKTAPRTAFTFADIAGHFMLGADPSYIPVVPVSADALIQLVAGGGLSAKPAFQGRGTGQNSGPQIHQTTTGDTLFGLASKYYKDAAQYQRIVKYNGLTPRAGNQQLPMGMKLRIP